MAGRPEVHARRMVREQHADLLERLADGRNVRGQGIGRQQVSAEGARGLVTADHGSREQPRVRVCVVDASTREDMDIGREGPFKASVVRSRANAPVDELPEGTCGDE